MKITSIPDEEKASKIANRLAQVRGYDSFCYIDDPGLREWIWEKSSKKICTKKFIVIPLFWLFTPVVVAFVFGLLLGMMFG